MLAEPVEIGDTELIHHLDQAAAALVVAGGERVDIALDLQRLAHIGAQDAQQVVVHLAFARQRHQRDREPLLEHLPSIGPHAETADIDDMDGAGEQADRLAAQKGRADHGQIVQMAAGQPRIIGDVMVALLHRRERKGVEEMLDRGGHRIDVAGGAGHRLGQHGSVAVEDAGREVAGLAHRGRERGAHQGLRLFLDHGDQARPHDLQMDLRQGGIRAGLHRKDPRLPASAQWHCMSGEAEGATQAARVYQLRRAAAAPRCKQCVSCSGSRTCLTPRGPVGPPHERVHKTNKRR